MWKACMLTKRDEPSVPSGGSLVNQGVSGHMCYSYVCNTGSMAAEVTGHLVTWFRSDLPWQHGTVNEAENISEGFRLHLDVLSVPCMHLK